MRQSGKTFRYLCQVLEKASKGEQCLYIGQTRQAAEYAYNMAFNMCRSISDEVVYTKYSTHKIRFNSSGGSIRFINANCSNPESILRGIKYDKIAPDYDPSYISRRTADDLFQFIILNNHRNKLDEKH